VSLTATKPKNIAAFHWTASTISTKEATFVTAPLVTSLVEIRMTLACKNQINTYIITKIIGNGVDFMRKVFYAACLFRKRFRFYARAILFPLNGGVHCINYE